MSSVTLNCFVRYRQGFCTSIRVDSSQQRIMDVRNSVFRELVGDQDRGIAEADLIPYTIDNLRLDEESDVEGLSKLVDESMTLGKCKKVGEILKVQSFAGGRELNIDDVHLVFVVDRYAVTIPSRRKTVEPADVYEQQKRTKLATVPPHKISSYSSYQSLQNDPDERLLDGRPRTDQGIPPIALLYYGYGHFLDICRGCTDVPDLEKVDQTRLRREVDNLARRMCYYYNTEESRRDTGLETIHNIFQSHSGTQIPRVQAAYMDSYKTECHVIGKHGGAAMIVEFKNEITGITSVPVVEATAYAAQTHKVHMESHKKVFLGWRVPCLGITVVGPSITFHAIIAVDHQYRVVPLTPTLSCLADASDGDDRKALYSAFTAASILLACILDDGARYIKSPPPEIPRPLRRFPAITRLRKHGSNDFLAFQIQRFHSLNQPRRLLYIAETEDGQDILVKFTRRYSIDLHEFCATQDRSPRIYAFERLPGDWYGIAMENISSATPLLSAEGLHDHGHRWIKELQDLAMSFHSAGFVHGDLRDPNIICNGDRVLLIDFDWGGKVGHASYPSDIHNLNPELLSGRSSVDTTITVSDDERVLKSTIDRVLSLITSS